jgi:hypothetical protein
LPNTTIKPRWGEESSSDVALWGDVDWDHNNRAIPLWASFAPEGGDQSYGSPDEVYSPAVMFYRHGGYEFLPMRRPHLDGVQPDEGWER